MSPVRINLIRVFIGFIVFTLAEVFSHASQMGIFNPVTLLLIYPLYFSHFFVLTTLAIRFQKTSLANLYWWGCIFGLYESFITKVVWFGFGGEGFVAGSILGFGILETLSAVFVQQPFMSFVIPIAIMQVLLNLVETGNPIFFKATGNSILKHKWIRFLVFLIPTSLFSSSPLGTSHLIWLVFSTAIIFYLGFKISIPKKPLEQNEVISVFYLGRIGLSICIAYLVFIYYMGYFVLGGDRRPSALQLILNCFLYLVIIALIFKKNTILHEEEHGLFDYLLETYTPRNLIKLFLRISIIAIIFSILSPLNIIFFAGSMYSMIPMGIASIYYFSYNFFQNQSSGGAQVINN